MPSKNHLVIEAWLCVVCLPIPLVPAAKISFFLSLASSVTFLRKSVWLHPGHTVLCLYTWALLPWLIHSILEWDLEKSLNMLFHSFCVYMGAVASHLSLTWHCHGWQNWEGRVFPFTRRTEWALSLACYHNRVHFWDNARTCEERLVTRSGMWNVSVCHCPSNASVLCDPSPQLSNSWGGGAQRKGVKGQAKIFWLFFGLPCCESCGLRFHVNTFLLNPPRTWRATCHSLPVKLFYIGIALLEDHLEWPQRNNKIPWPRRENRSPTCWEPKHC